MSNLKKPFLAILISLLFFAGYYFLANTELLNFIQTHFYNPSVLNSYIKENNIDAEIVQSHIFELQNNFANTLTEPAVQNSFLYNQNAEDIFERSRIYGILLESTAGLQAVQFIDSNGLRIHYSTSPRDILSQNQNSASYRNYNEDPNALPYETIGVNANNAAKFTMDEQNGRIIFSFPFFDSMEIYRGTALFTVSVRAFAEKLIAQGRLKVNDDVSVTGTPPGILFGSPASSKSEVIKKTSAIWRDGVQNRVTFDAEESGIKYSLISLRTGRGIFFGRLINDELFSISDSMKLILQLSIFLTFFVTLFFLINFRPSPATIVRNRLKNLKDSLFEQLYINKSGQERAKWILELEQRRGEIKSELKRHLKLNRRMEKSINELIDSSWDELLVILKSGSHQVLPDEKETFEEIEEIGEVDEIGDETAEEFDEINEAEEAGEIEEIGDTEEFTEEAEGLEEIDEIDEIDEIEEIEEISETAKESPAHHKGLLELASEKEAEEEQYTPVTSSKGLLGLASEIKSEEGQYQPVTSSKGLLGLASSIHVEKKTTASSKGLLALASEIEAEETHGEAHKGLLALASEIEFNRDAYPVTAEEEEDLDANLDIVSPFSSMFLSLE